MARGAATEGEGSEYKMILRYSIPIRAVGQNHGTIQTRHGRVKTPESRAFASALASHGQRAVTRAGWRTVKAPAEVDVLITVWRADRRLDADAPVKAILDSLQRSRAHRIAAHRRIGAGVIERDSQVRDYAVWTRLDPSRPRIEIEVWCSGEEQRIGIVSMEPTGDHVDDQAFPTITGGRPL